MTLGAAGGYGGHDGGVDALEQLSRARVVVALVLVDRDADEDVYEQRDDFRAHRGAFAGLDAAERCDDERLRCSDQACHAGETTAATFRRAVGTRDMPMQLRLPTET
jgi:hypothetical protein